MVKNILQGVISSSGLLMENGDGRKFEGRRFAFVKRHFLVHYWPSEYVRLITTIN
jgi:hypothetical protein